jgi:hypothetical protein
MNYIVKLVLSIFGMIIFILAAILSTLNMDTIVLAIISGLAAFVDAFVFMIPFIFRVVSIDSSQIDPNVYNYDNKSFVDRKEIYREITNQIDTLKITKEAVMWIRLFGEDGIGKKALVSKLFQKYKYPLNKFYFLGSEDKIKIIDQINNKYPLKNEIYNEKIYLHKLAKSKRTFVVIEANYVNIDLQITEMLSDWNNEIHNKHKLIFITLDSNSSISNLKNQSYIFEYELKRLGNIDSIKFINKLLKRNSDINPNDIFKISNGLPATIKFICEQYNKTKNIIEQTNWLEQYLKLNDEIKGDFLKLCLLTLMDGKIKKKVVKSILNDYNISFLIAQKILVVTNDKKYYVPAWLINTLLISDNYKSDLLHQMELISRKIQLNPNKARKIDVLICKDSKKLLIYMRDLEKQKSYIQIKELYNKFLMEFDYKNVIDREIIIIFMKSLLELGEYGLFYSLYQKYNVPITENMSYEDFQVNLLIADYYHLTSQYDNSNLIFETLLINTDWGQKNIHELKFYLAHNLRHQGELEKAKFIFNELLTINDISNKYYVRAVTSIVSIDIFENNNFDPEEALHKLEPLIANETVKYNVYRHIANIYKRQSSTLYQAIKFLKEKINDLEISQLRILQDYYFELAECYRIKCKNNKAYYNFALTYYNKALLFAELNHDINLKINVQIGKALLNYLNDRRIDRLKKSLEFLMTEASISQVISYCILTLLSIINNTDISKQLEKQHFFHYLQVLESKDVNSMYITVM